MYIKKNKTLPQTKDTNTPPSPYPLLRSNSNINNEVSNQSTLIRSYSNTKNDHFKKKSSYRKEQKSTRNRSNTNNDNLSDGIRLVLKFVNDQDDGDFLVLENPLLSVAELLDNIEQLTNRTVEDVKLKDFPLNDKNIPLLRDLERIYVKFKVN